MAADVDEANSTFGDEASRESNGGAEQFRSLFDGQQLFHDSASCGARWEAPTFGYFTVSTEHQGHHRLHAELAGDVAPRGRRPGMSCRCAGRWSPTPRCSCRAMPSSCTIYPLVAQPARLGSGALGGRGAGVYGLRAPSHMANGNRGTSDSPNCRIYGHRRRIANCNADVRLYAPNLVGRGNEVEAASGSCVQDVVMLSLVSQAEPDGFVDRYAKRPESANGSGTWDRTSCSE